MATVDTKRLGYGGSAQIKTTGGADATQVLITGGSMEQPNAPTYLEMANIPPDTSSQSKVLHSDGVTSFAGTLNFDVTVAALAFFSTSKLLQRRYQFDVGIHDGENKWTMSECYLTTLTLSGAPAGVISASLSYMSKDARDSGPSVVNAYILDDAQSIPLGYWWSGNSDVKEWTFTMNQVVEPVYTNENTSNPRYLKVGLVEYLLDVTCYSDQSHNDIYVATTSFTLTGVTAARGYAFNGVNDLGMYTHSFITAASATSGSGGVIIT